MKPIRIMTEQVEVGLVRNFQGRSLFILISVSNIVKMAKILVLANVGPGNSMSQSFT